jgi:hypothetical protein
MLGTSLNKALLASRQSWVDCNIPRVLSLLYPHFYGEIAAAVADRSRSMIQPANLMSETVGAISETVEGDAVEKGVNHG